MYPWYKDPRVLAVSSSVIALSIGSPSSDPLDIALGEPGPFDESGWKAAYGAARMAVEIARESSDMFLPLKAVVGALMVLIRNYDVSLQVFRPICRRPFLAANHRQRRPDQRNRGKGGVAGRGTRISGG